MQHGIPVLSTQALYPIPCLLGSLPIDCDQCEIIEEIYQENIRAGDRDALQPYLNATPELLDLVGERLRRRYLNPRVQELHQI